MRQAVPEDMAGVMAMIQELADYEKMSDGPKINAHSMYWNRSLCNNNDLGRCQSN